MSHHIEFQIHNMDTPDSVVQRSIHALALQILPLVKAHHGDAITDDDAWSHAYTSAGMGTACALFNCVQQLGNNLNQTDLGYQILTGLLSAPIIDASIPDTIETMEDPNA